jgi:translation initiation factor 4G
LNKLTPEKFQPLSNDLLSLNLNSKKILLGVIHLIFEKALDEPKYSSMYAQLCHRISKEGSTLEAENDYFENLLIRVCRDKFINRSQYSDRIINSLLATEIDEEERRYVAKQKILGNVKFIGELFKLGMLNAAIIHNMLEQLLDKKSRSHPTLEDRCEDMECLSQIFKTCGKQLDTEKSKNLIDQYFEIMEHKSNSYKYPPRIRFLLRDVIELRRDGWTPRKIARVEGPVPIQDLSSDEDYLRQQREARTRAMEYQNRNSDRNWMDKLPLSLQSSMNNYGPLSMTSSSSIINMNINHHNYNNQQQGRGGGGGNDERGNNERGGYRNHRNQDNNQRPMGKYNNQNDGKINPNKMKHHRQYDGGYQNHHHGHNNHNSYNNNNNNNGNNNNPGNVNPLSKEMAPRFKRNIVTPATPNSVDDLQMRPSPNSLLFKASSMKPNQQSMGSMNRSATGSPSIDNLIPSFNNMNPSNGRNTSSPQLQQQHQNSQGIPPTSHFMTAAQSKNSANHQHQNLKTSPTPNSPQNIQNSSKENLSQNHAPIQQQTLVTKQGSVEKPKPKKDKGPSKDDVMKKVLQFLSENLLDKKFLDNYQKVSELINCEIAN